MKPFVQFCPESRKLKVLNSSGGPAFVDVQVRDDRGRTKQSKTPLNARREINPILTLLKAMRPHFFSINPSEAYCGKSGLLNGSSAPEHGGAGNDDTNSRRERDEQ
jgi:hypothetical protein